MGVSLFKKEKGYVMCLACNHYCKILEGKTGICGVRKNVNSSLVLLVYGKIASWNADPIEKKPLYHFLPSTNTFSIGTIGCNFKCIFCQNYEISQEKDIFGEEFSPREIVEKAIKAECSSIAYTYNEPTIFLEFALDCAKIAKKKGIKNVLVTNGYMSKEAILLCKNYIDAMNIDLKSFSDKFYQEMCGAKLLPVLNTIREAHRMRIWIEITTLLIPGKNDSEEELTNIAKFIASVDKNIPWHISRFFPMYKMKDEKPTEIISLQRAFEIGKKYLNYVYLGNLEDESDTFCPKCKNLLIKRIGYNITSFLVNGRCSKCHKRIEGVFQ